MLMGDTNILIRQDCAQYLFQFSHALVLFLWEEIQVFFSPWPSYSDIIHWRFLFIKKNPYSSAMIILNIYFKWGKNLFATNFSCVLLSHNDWKRPAAREYFWDCSLGLRRLDLHKDFSVFPPTDGVLGYHLHERTQSVCSLAENWCYSVYPVLSMPHPFLWKAIPLSLPSHCPHAPQSCPVTS